MAYETRTDATRRAAPEGAAPDMLVGDRYQLGDVVGRGGMGTVYRAHDVVLDRPVALKLFPLQPADRQQAIRYEQEARLLARVNHPGLVTVYDAGVTDGSTPYLVMELLEGSTLADRLARGALSEPEIGELAVQVASALGHLHRRGIVHRDVKPANIVLTPPGDRGPRTCAVLTDFGIARLIDGTRITMTGFTMGTANYLSPEQVTGGEVGPASDIYSLGLVLLECFTAAVAYPGAGPEAALPRLHRPPAIPDSVPPEWARLLRAMTDREPAARPSAAEVAAQLGSIADRPTVAVSNAAEPVAQTKVLPAVEAPRGRRLLPARLGRRLLPALLVGAVILAVVIIALATSGGGGSPAPSRPHYPAVPGRLGSDLHRLQQDVGP